MQSTIMMSPERAPNSGSNAFDKKFIEDCKGLGQEVVNDHAIRVLIKKWEAFQNGYRDKHIGDTDKCLESLLICTSRLVFDCRYSKNISKGSKNDLKGIIEACGQNFVDSSHQRRLCAGVSSIMGNPWGAASFNNAMNTKSKEKDEAAETLWQTEGWIMLETRIDYLARLGIKCIDRMCTVLHVLVQNGHKMFQSSQSCDSASKTPSTSFHPYRFSYEKYIQYLEVYAILCFNENIHSQTIETWKEPILLDVISGLRRKVTDDKLRLFPKFKSWKNAGDTAKYLAQKATWKALQSKGGGLLEDFFNQWIELSNCGNSEEQQLALNSLFDEILKDIGNISVIENLYKVANITIKAMGITSFTRPIFVELFVTAMTKDISEIESLKNAHRDNTDLIRGLDINLSKRYLDLTNFFKEYPRIAKDCLLTAFSLNPCYQLYYLLFPNQKHEENVSKVESDDNDIILSEYSELINLHFDQHDTHTEEDLGLVKSLCDDLENVIKNPRYKGFLGRSEDELKELCRKLLDSKSVSVIENKRLDHLEVDYEKYKDLKPQYDPEDDGIEKGYRLGERLRRRNALKPRNNNCRNRNGLTGSIKKARMNVSKHHRKLARPGLVSNGHVFRTGRKGRPPKIKLNGDIYSRTHGGGRRGQEERQMPNVSLSLNPFLFGQNDEFNNYCTHAYDSLYSSHPIPVYKDKTTGRNSKTEEQIIGCVTRTLKNEVRVSSSDEKNGHSSSNGDLKRGTEPQFGKKDSPQVNNCEVPNSYQNSKPDIANVKNSALVHNTHGLATVDQPAMPSGGNFNYTINASNFRIQNHPLSQDPTYRPLCILISKIQMSEAVSGLPYRSPAVPKSNRNQVNKKEKLAKKTVNNIRKDVQSKNNVQQSRSTIHVSNSTTLVIDDVNNYVPTLINNVNNTSGSEEVSEKVINSQEASLKLEFNCATSTESQSSGNPTTAMVENIVTETVPEPPPKPPVFAGAFQIMGSYTKGDKQDTCENQSIPSIKQDERTSFTVTCPAKIPPSDNKPNMDRNITGSIFQRKDPIGSKSPLVPFHVQEAPPSTVSIQNKGPVIMKNPLKTYSNTNKNKRRLVIKTNWDSKLDEYKSSVPKVPVELAIPFEYQSTSNAPSTTSVTCNSNPSTLTSSFTEDNCSKQPDSSHPTSSFSDKVSLAVDSSPNESIKHAKNILPLTLEVPKSSGVTNCDKRETLQIVRSINNIVRQTPSSMVSEMQSYCNTDITCIVGSSSTPTTEVHNELVCESSENGNGLSSPAHLKSYPVLPNATESCINPLKNIPTFCKSSCSTDTTQITNSESPISGTSASTENSLPFSDDPTSNMITPGVSEKEKNNDKVEVPSKTVHAHLSNNSYPRHIRSDIDRNNDKETISASATVPCKSVESDEVQNKSIEKVELDLRRLTHLSSLLTKKETNNGDSKVTVKVVNLPVYAITAASKNQSKDKSEPLSTSSEVIMESASENDPMNPSIQDSRQRELGNATAEKMNENLKTPSIHEVGQSIEDNFVSSESIKCQTDACNDDLTHTSSSQINKKIENSNERKYTKTELNAQGLLQDDLLYHHNKEGVDCASSVVACGKCDDAVERKDPSNLDGRKNIEIIDERSETQPTAIYNNSVVETNSLNTRIGEMGSEPNGSYHDVNDLLCANSANNEVLQLSKETLKDLSKKLSESGKSINDFATDVLESNLRNNESSNNLCSGTTENEGSQSESAVLKQRTSDKDKADIISISSDADKLEAISSVSLFDDGTESARKVISDILDELESIENEKANGQWVPFLKGQQNQDGALNASNQVNISVNPSSDNNEDLSVTFAQNNTDSFSKESLNVSEGFGQTSLQAIECCVKNDQNSQPSVLNGAQSYPIKSQLADQEHLFQNEITNEKNCEDSISLDNNEVDESIHCHKTVLNENVTEQSLDEARIVGDGETDEITFSDQASLTSPLMDPANETIPRSLTPVNVLEDLINTKMKRKPKRPYDEEDRIKVAPSVVKHVETYGGRLRGLLLCVVELKRVAPELVPEKSRSQLNPVKRSTRLKKKKMRTVEVIKTIQNSSNSIDDDSKSSLSDSDSDIQFLEEVPRNSTSLLTSNGSAENRTTDRVAIANRTFMKRKITSDSGTEISPSCSPGTRKRIKSGFQGQQSFQFNIVNEEQLVSREKCDDLDYTVLNASSKNGRSSTASGSTTEAEGDDLSPSPHCLGVVMRTNGVFVYPEAVGDQQHEEEIVTIDEEKDPLALDECSSYNGDNDEESSIIQESLVYIDSNSDDSNDKDYDTLVNRLSAQLYDRDRAKHIDAHNAIVSPSFSPEEQNIKSTEKMLGTLQGPEVGNEEVSKENLVDGDINVSEIEILLEETPSCVSKQKPRCPPNKISLPSRPANAKFNMMTRSRQTLNFHCRSTRLTTDQTTNNRLFVSTDVSCGIPEMFPVSIDGTQVPDYLSSTNQKVNSNMASTNDSLNMLENGEDIGAGGMYILPDFGETENIEKNISTECRRLTDLNKGVNNSVNAESNIINAAADKDAVDANEICFVDAILSGMLENTNVKNNTQVDTLQHDTTNTYSEGQDGELVLTPIIASPIEMPCSNMNLTNIGCQQKEVTNVQNTSITGRRNDDCVDELIENASGYVSLSPISEDINSATSHCSSNKKDNSMITVTENIIVNSKVEVQQYGGSTQSTSQDKDSQFIDESIPVDHLGRTDDGTVALSNNDVSTFNSEEKNMKELSVTLLMDTGEQIKSNTNKKFSYGEDVELLIFQSPTTQTATSENALSVKMHAVGEIQDSASEALAEKLQAPGVFKSDVTLESCSDFEIVVARHEESGECIPGQNETESETESEISQSVSCHTTEVMKILNVLEDNAPDTSQTRISQETNCVITPEANPESEHGVTLCEDSSCLKTQVLIVEGSLCGNIETNDNSNLSECRNFPVNLRKSNPETLEQNELLAENAEKVCHFKNIEIKINVYENDVDDIPPEILLHEQMSPAIPHLIPETNEYERSYNSDEEPPFLEKN